MIGSLMYTKYWELQGLRDTPIERTQKSRVNEGVGIDKRVMTFCLLVPSSTRFFQTKNNLGFGSISVFGDLQFRFHSIYVLYFTTTVSIEAGRRAYLPTDMKRENS